MGRQSCLQQGRGSLLSKATSPSGISETGPVEFTPEAPGSGSGFSAQAWHTAGGGPRRPGGVERAV